jgi:DnaJ-class molecular chaperone
VAMSRGKAIRPKGPIREQVCWGCAGTGFLAVVQPKQQGRRIFPPRCLKCEGKGKVPIK